MPSPKLLFFLNLFSLFFASSIIGTESPPVLTCKGTASIFKPADELQLDITAVVQEKDAEDALRENTKKMHAIIDKLLQNGVDKKDYHTGTFSIRQLYSQRPKNAKPNWSPEIIGYEVTNSLKVKTEKIDAAGKLIDLAVKSGADNINHIAFFLKDPHKFREEAIDAAAKNAIHDAKVLSEAVGVKLQQIKTVSLGEFQPLPPRAAPFFAKSLGSSPPIEAGDIEISASVTIQYEIE